MILEAKYCVYNTMQQKSQLHNPVGLKMDSESFLLTDSEFEVKKILNCTFSRYSSGPEFIAISRALRDSGESKQGRMILFFENERTLLL